MSDSKQKHFLTRPLNRRNLLRAGAGAAALSAAGFSLPQARVSAQATIKLDFPSWQAEEPGFSDWWKGLISAFQTDNPNVEINLNQIPFAQYVDTLTTRFAANDAPDIVHLPSRNFYQFADQGWLASLTDCLTEAGVVTSDDKPDQWIDLESEMVWDGEVRGLLLLGYGYIFFYNQKMLDDAGVAVPTTPDELVAAAKAMTTGDVFGYGGTTADHPNVYTEASTFVLGAGQQWVKDGKYNLTAPEVAEALTPYRDVLKYSPKGQTSELNRQLFFNGKVGMIMDGPWVLAGREDAPADVQPNIKVGPIPFSTTTGGASNSLHMPDSLKGDKADIVSRFIQLAASPEWQDKYAALTKSPAGRKGAVTEETLKANPELELFNEAASKAVSSIPNDKTVKTNYTQFSKIMVDGIVRMITSDDDTAAVLKDTQDQLEDQVPL
jgi:multiple sugar transport system substrate-binding protein